MLDTMKAAINRKYGGPTVLQVEELGKPKVGKRDLLIKVRASTVNRTDCGILTGKPYIIRLFTGRRKPKHHIGGTDFVGEVVEVGSEVTTFHTGDVVFGFHDEGLQSHADYLVIAQDGNVMTVPDSVDPLDALCSVEGGHYAKQSIESTGVEPGMKVLVNGASGAIGSAAMQLYHHAGAQVTGIAAAEHHTILKELGASHMIDYKTQNVLFLDEKYDVILDTVGNISFLSAKNILKKGGRYTSSELGPCRENIRYALLTKAIGDQKCTFPIPKNIKGSLTYLSDLLSQKNFKPLRDDHSFELDTIQSAFVYVMKGHKRGNVVLNR